MNSDGNITGITSRLYPIQAPEQTSFPYVVFYQTALEPYDTKSGSAKIDDCYVSIDCYTADSASASGYADVANLAQYIREALDRVTPGTYSDITVDGVRFLGADMGFEKQSDSYIISLEFKLRVLRNVTGQYSGGFMTTYIITTDTNYITAHANALILIDASSNTVEYTLPASPADNLEITFVTIDVTNAATVVTSGGKTINGAATTYTFQEQFASITLRYVADLDYWVTKHKE